MPIRALEHGWLLETDHSTYAFGLNPAGLLTHRYFGLKLLHDDDYPPAPNPAGFGPFSSAAHLTPEEYPAVDDMKFIEPCLKITFADGVRDTRLEYESAEIHGDTLQVHLRDVFYPLRVTLNYRVHEKYDLIERRAAIRNLGDEPITVERAYSAQWHLPGDQYRLTHLNGRWFDEMHTRREKLLPGKKVLESRRLTSGHHHQPWYAIDRGTADETQGEVWYGLLEWSGNWKFVAEVTEFFSTRLSIGVNEWDFAWRLESGATFTTPSAFAGYTPDGFGAASRKLHDFVRDTVLPHPGIEHKVYYNSWEATLWDVDEASQLRLAEIAAKMGCEMFMIDDGWYLGRYTQDTGVGDWTPDPGKFPDGLAPLIDKVNALGMDFGLWFEPEMVNPDSNLYRAHPDWTIHYPTRASRLGRSALILNFARDDVQNTIIESLDFMLKNHNIRYVNWDMNRNISEGGWHDAPGDPRELPVRYVQGLYHVWQTLRAKHPNVIFQSCSGGGGRIDLAMLRLTDLIWISDNSGGASRLAIQEGYSQMFPATTMQAWLTDQEAHLSLAFRFHSAMCGMLGIGANILKWSDADLDEAARWIALYKEIRHIIQQGDLHRLSPAEGSQFTAVQYQSKDGSEGVLFVFRVYVTQHEPSLTVRLRGLTPDARYTIEGFDGTRSGLAWMNTDLQFGLYGGLKNLASTVRRIRRID